MPILRRPLYNLFQLIFPGDWHENGAGIFHKWISFLATGELSNTLIPSTGVKQYFQRPTEELFLGDAASLRYAVGVMSTGLMWRQMERKLSFCRWVMTAKGRMGFCCRGAETENRIALISGLPNLFLVRETGGAYSLVGPAFIYGLMEGEEWPAENAETVLKMDRAHLT